MFEGKYPIYFEDKPTGEAQISPQGLYVRFVCDCGPVRGKVLHLAMVTDGGTVSLGVPVPRQDRLVLERKLSARSLGEGDVGKLCLYDIWPLPVEEPREPAKSIETEMEIKEDLVENKDVQMEEKEAVEPETEDTVEEGFLYVEGEPLPEVEHWERMRTVPGKNGELRIVVEE